VESEAPQPIVLAARSGEIVGDSPDRRVEILSDDDALHATWSRFGPHREGADLHVHRHHTDLFYVLEGELTIRLGPEDAPVAMPTGTLVRVPPLVVHGFRNGSDADVRYLNLHAPGQGFADYMRALRDGRTLSYDQHPPPPDGGRPPTEAVIGGAEVVADQPGLRVALLADVEAIGISETWLDLTSSAPESHLHPSHVESFYVLAGEIAFTVGDREFLAEAGAWVEVPPGVPHALAFPGETPVRFLDLHTPSCGFGTFLRALHGASDEDERRAAQAAFDQVALRAKRSGNHKAAEHAHRGAVAGRGLPADSRPY
jgi:mannose-6-phosphate isomerase-like protein (cupin superfamily)